MIRNNNTTLERLYTFLLYRFASIYQKSVFWIPNSKENGICSFAKLFCCCLSEFQELDLKDELAVRHDPPGRETTAAVGVIRRAGQPGDFALGHADDALVPSLDDLSHSHLELEDGLARVFCGCCCNNCLVLVFFRRRKEHKKRAVRRTPQKLVGDRSLYYVDDRPTNSFDGTNTTNKLHRYMTCHAMPCDR